MTMTYQPCFSASPSATSVGSVEMKLDLSPDARRFAGYEMGGVAGPLGVRAYIHEVPTDDSGPYPAALDAEWTFFFAPWDATERRLKSHVSENDGPADIRGLLLDEIARWIKEKD